MINRKTQTDIDDLLKNYGFNNYYYHINGNVILFDIKESEFYCFETAGENVVLFELEGENITTENIYNLLKNNI